MTALAMTEAELQAAVIDAARLAGYRVAHFRTALNSRGHYMTPVAADGAGFPDLVLAGRGRLLFLELKSARGRVSVDQAEWLRVLKASGVDARVVRPDDLDALIVELLGSARMVRP
jgi:hypothetical protein